MQDALNPSETTELFKGLIKEGNFCCEEHKVKTEDGYVLTLFRVQSGPKIDNSNKKPQILLQHGLLDSADNFFVNGERKSIGFVLASLGYDVWASNSRGNKYSLTHESFSTKDKEFWEFSFHEMGIYDIPANLRYIQNHTSVEKIIFVGHSQGTSQMFVALSDENSQEYVNSTVTKFVALGPVVYLANQGHNIISRTLGGIGVLNKAADAFKIWNVMPNLGAPGTVTSKMLSFCMQNVPMVGGVFTAMAEMNPAYDDIEKVHKFSQHVPSGSSLKCLNHFEQLIRSEKKSPRFTYYNYGEDKNLDFYNQKEAPEYNLENIKIPVRTFVGIQDTLGNVLDNAYLNAKMIEHNINFKEYLYKDSGHMTFMWGKNPARIFGDILKEIEFCTIGKKHHELYKKSAQVVMKTAKKILK